MICSILGPSKRLVLRYIYLSLWHIGRSSSFCSYIAKWLLSGEHRKCHQGKWTLCVQVLEISFELSSHAASSYHRSESKWKLGMKFVTQNFVIWYLLIDVLIRLHKDAKRTRPPDLNLRVPQRPAWPPRIFVGYTLDLHHYKTGSTAKTMLSYISVRGPASRRKACKDFFLCEKSGIQGFDSMALWNGTSRAYRVMNTFSSRVVPRLMPLWQDNNSFSYVSNEKGSPYPRIAEWHPKFHCWAAISMWTSRIWSCHAHFCQIWITTLDVRKWER